MFERAKDDPEDLELAMRRIEDESKRMAVMVEELLVLARLGEGREPEQLPVDLARVVGDAVNDARAAAPTRDISLERVETADVLGDEHQLRQVVANLLTNALLHTPGEAQIRVTLTAAAGRATLAVADDGPGMEPDVAAEVFEPFYRADESRARDTGGAGLGLAIVAAIVNVHGGAVTLRSAPGAGATFTERAGGGGRLPRRRARLPPRVRQSLAASRAAGGDRRRTGGTSEVVLQGRLGARDLRGGASRAARRVVEPHVDLHQPVALGGELHVSGFHVVLVEQRLRVDQPACIPLQERLQQELAPLEFSELQGRVHIDGCVDGWHSSLPHGGAPGTARERLST